MATTETTLSVQFLSEDGAMSRLIKIDAPADSVTSRSVVTTALAGLVTAYADSGVTIPSFFYIKDGSDKVALTQFGTVKRTTKTEAELS